ncbi:hypothetical protein LWM68_36775 [Niabella sp. W65]|nr:hypothetical protein [Niabella sp. W65]MCH7367816.1 hypothetical protein [Niabella sp. W65]
MARIESSKLILQKINAIAKGAPVILTGDFNAGRNTEPYQIIANSAVVRDTYKDVQHPYENNSSFNGFKKNLKAPILSTMFSSANSGKLRSGAF